MKLVVAGSRSLERIQFDDFSRMLIEQLIDMHECGLPLPTAFVSGCARGIDKMAELWATQNGYPCLMYPAHWDLYGRAAGPRRNVEMAHVGDALLAFWDGTSTGTAHMVRTMRSLGKPVREVVVDFTPDGRIRPA